MLISMSVSFHVSFVARHLLLQDDNGKSIVLRMTTDIELDPRTPALEEALLHSGLSQTAFGYKYFGDPAFVKKMREGRKFRRPMAEKIDAILKEMGL
jgi:hypothetical protein